MAAKCGRMEYDMLEKLVIWFFCAFCMMRTDQEFKYDDGIYEIYECQLCNHENRVAVR